MKKFLRFMLVLILVVVAGILVLGLVEPKDVVVTRVTVIKASKDVVFEQMVKFKNWLNWSPWYQMDPTMKITYEGNNGEAGSSYHWVGDIKKTGEGEMRNNSVSGTTLNYQVTFTKPQRGTSQGIIKAEDTAGMTKATWNCTVHMGFPFNAMFLFLDMDKMLGGDFEHGLENLKKYVEGHSTFVDIKEVDFPAHTYAGIRSMVFWSDMSKYFMDSYGSLGKDLGPKIAGPAVGIFYVWDTVNKRSDMAAAFPVADTTVKLKDAVYTQVPASKAFMAVQTGGYSKSMEYHTALGKKVAEKGKEMAMVIEEYISGPGKEPDSNKWVTNIYYLVK